MVIRFFIFIFLLNFAAYEVCAKNLGVHGQIFQIQEINLLKYFERKLNILKNDGTLAQKQKEFADKVKHKTLTPPKVSFVTNTDNPRVFHYDPTFTLQQDLSDHRGIVFHKAGTKVNPFDHQINFTNLVLLDGENKSHLQWLTKQIGSSEGKLKVILVNGSPLKLAEELSLPVYFDQHGLICKKLGITQVPALVSREDKMLRIEEIKMKEENND
jgi:conjugal transfer pilus assembly protein TraW